MIHIITDTSSLYSPQEAEAIPGFHSVPLYAGVDGTMYRDYEEVNAAQMNEFCRSGASVSSSQPSIGEKADLYNRILEDPENEIVDLTIGSGLSGTWQSACTARDLSNDPERVHIIDSRTLCGPHRFMVQQLLVMREKGCSIEEMKKWVEAASETEVSCVIVPDLKFLVRGGRVPRLAGAAGELLRLMPIAGKTGGAEKLGLMGASRTFSRAYQSIVRCLRENGAGKDTRILIGHGCCEKQAFKARDVLHSAFPEAEIEVRELCSMFMVHGGPGCISIQSITVRP